MAPKKIKRLEVEKQKAVKSIGIEVVQSTHTDFYFDVSLFLDFCLIVSLLLKQHPCFDQKLPSEILHLVFTHLRKSELARAALVCCKWAEVARDPRLWDAFQLTLNITCRYFLGFKSFDLHFLNIVYRQLGGLTDMLECPRFTLGVKKVVILF